MSARIDSLVGLALEAGRGHEFDTFLVGSILYKETRRREEALYERLADLAPQLRRVAKAGEASAPAFEPAEYLKAEVNRETGKRIEKATGKRVEFQKPDVTFEIDTRLDHVRLRVASVFVSGRYRKHDRNLPQTRWPCRLCQGLGCRRCGYQGKTYEESVEELVAGPFLQASQATGEAFHGMGREDIDARMLGRGRPFVLELKFPKIRRFDWASLVPLVGAGSGGRVEIVEVVPADAGAPARFKDADPEKSYVARCVAATPVDIAALEGALARLRGVALDQRTPERVSHRRADLVRARSIVDLRLVEHGGDRFAIEVRAESGTYIKEFVSGDEGRTNPSLAGTLGVPCKVEELDVVDVHWPSPAPGGAVGL